MGKFRYVGIGLVFVQASLLAASVVPEGMSQAEYDRNMIILSSKGLPLPNTGIKVVPVASLGMTEIEVTKLLTQAQAIQQKGFYEDNNPRAQELLNLKYTADFQKKRYMNEPEPWKTHLRSQTSELKMAYEFIGVPPAEMTIYHGIAPSGVYRDNGWSGATQLFDTEGLGSFAYTEDNFEISHGAVRVAREVVRYDINNKPTLISVSGNKKSGFVYVVEWFDKRHAHKLECAHIAYLPELTEKVITFAKKIDSAND